MPIAAVHAAQPAPTIDALKWQQRVLLVFAGDDDAASRAQADALMHAPDAMRDRDLRVATIHADRVEGLADDAATLRRRFGVAADRFAVLLIGKDGGVVDRSAVSVSAAHLFERIDAMPMRRDEMRRRGR